MDFHNESLTGKVRAFCGVSFLWNLGVAWPGGWRVRCIVLRFSSVWSLSHVRLFATPWTVARRASLSTTNSWSSLRLMPSESVMTSDGYVFKIYCCVPNVKRTHFINWKEQCKVSQSSFFLLFWTYNRHWRASVRNESQGHIKSQGLKLRAKKL